MPTMDIVPISGGNLPVNAFIQINIKVISKDITTRLRSNFLRYRIIILLWV